MGYEQIPEGGTRKVWHFVDEPIPKKDLAPHPVPTPRPVRAVQPAPAQEAAQQRDAYAPLAYAGHGPGPNELVYRMRCHDPRLGANAPLHARETTALKVKLTLPFIGAIQAPFWCALDQGFYRDVDLDVELMLNPECQDPITAVERDLAHVAVTSGLDSALAARGRDPDVVVLGILHRDADFQGLMVRADSPVRSFQDLAGRSIGVLSWHDSTLVIESVLRRLGVYAPYHEVGYVRDALLGHQVEARWCFRPTAHEVYEPSVALRILSPAEVGVHSHGNTLVTNREHMEDRREDILRFVAATARGCRFTLERPEEAVAILQRHGMELPGPVALQCLREYGSYFRREGAEVTLAVTPSDCASTYRRLREVGLIKQPFDLDETVVARARSRVA